MRTTRPCSTMLWSLTAALGIPAPAPVHAEPEEPPPAEETLDAVGADQPDETVETADASSLKVDLQFAVRVNLFHKSWVSGSDRNKAEFDTIMVGVDTTQGPLFTSLQYRFYDGYNMLHHGYVGYHCDDTAEIQVGVTKVPFGLLPYASHNWFFNLTYYIGMEDDYDLGAKLILDRGPLNVQLAYFARDEGNYYGDSVDSARYSYDVVKANPGALGDPAVTMPRTNQERNQLNARLAYTFDHGDVCSTEVGCSAEWGQLRNATTGRSGEHWSGAVHLNGNYDRFNVQLEAARFANHPENPPGQDDSFVIRGAYDAPYEVAAEGWMLVGNVAYRIPLKWKPFDAVTLYTDTSWLLKTDSAFSSSQQIVAGASIEAGPALIYIDFAFGKNHPWLGPNYTTSLAAGDPNAGWEFRFNINIGFYF